MNKNLKLTYTFFCLLFLSASLFAKSEIINSILITGNETTKDIIILRELNFSQNDILDSNKFKASEKKLFETNLFRNVNISNHYDIDTDKNYVIVSVREKWYIYPIPYYTFVNGRIKKPSFGINLTHLNFFGLNHKITATGQWLNETVYKFEYDLRKILQSNFYLSVFVAYKKTFRREYIIEQNNEDLKDYLSIEKFSSGMNLKYKFDNFNSITFSQLLNNDIVQEQDESFTDYKYPTSTLEFIHDSFNFKDFPSTGHFVKFTMTSYLPVLGKYNNFSKHIFTELSFKKPISLYPFRLGKRKFKYFRNDKYIEKKKSRIVLALDFNFKQIVGNKIPNYKKLILGFDSSIRGINKKIAVEVIHKNGVYLQFFLWKSREVDLLGQNYKKATNYNSRITKNKHNTFEIYAELFQENINLSESMKWDNVTNFEDIFSTAGFSLYFKGPIITDFLRIDLAFDLHKKRTLENPSFGIAVVNTLF